ncbi:GntR family transcriptional regulator [Mangrovicoccus ximenensis]|uniref:GntR family transcriptional regulator n=1 Tax=Mangrovicoccus ximenensis TaxID=1911570 RepID=UPI000D3715B2|nr:GntR family transcriptional regulator [Mangrovicoccus ximenensis]
MARKALPKIERKPVEQQALEALREAVVTGAIAPGERITEINLAAEMALSRATLRAALHQLAQEGLVTLVPYTGWRVLKLRPADVDELYTLRAALERLAAQLAAEPPSRALPRRGRRGTGRYCAAGSSGGAASSTRSISPASISRPSTRPSAAWRRAAR